MNTDLEKQGASVLKGPVYNIGLNYDDFMIDDLLKS